MRRATAVLGAVALVLWTISLSAQAKPNFAGKWTLVPDAAAAPPAAPPAGGGGGGGRGGGRGGGWGMEATITQDANTLTVEYMGGGQNPAPVKLVYKLDGSESKNSVMGRGGQAMEQVSKATWDGSKLVIKTTMQNGEQVRTVSLEGGNLVIETTTPNPQGGDPFKAKATYKKG